MTNDAQATHAKARSYVQARLDDRLAPELEGWLKTHLAGCDECARYARELEQVARLLPETFQARWDDHPLDRAVKAPRPAAAVPNQGAYPPIGGPTMLARQKRWNLAGVGLGMGALVVLLVGVAFALQIATAPVSQVPGQGVEATSPPPMFTAPPVQTGTHVTFGEAIALEGYSIFPTEGGVTVELLWHALAAPAGDYSVGVFIMPDGAQSAILAQSDTVPAGGARPTRGWQPGEYLLDAHPLTLNIDPGVDLANLVVWVNVYDPQTGDRLPSDPPGGGPFNAVSIGVLSYPAEMPPTATPLPLATGEDCLANPCTPTPTPACPPEAECVENDVDPDATSAMAATLGWTATPIGFVPSVTPCQSGCEPLWATGTAAALTGATGTPAPFDLSATPPPLDGINYTVHEGDTLEGIAAFYGVPAAVILEANGLASADALVVGQVLFIPIVPTPSATPGP